MEKLYTNTPISKEYNKSGIYLIKIGRKFYVGSSINIKHRLTTHKRRLLLSKHENIIMINSFNKYGKESCYFKVLEYCDTNILLEREKFYINLIKPKLNIELDPVSQNGIYKSKKVYRYSLNGEYLNSFKSTADAERFMSKSSNKISQCCLKVRKSAYGFLWSYKKLKTIKYKNNSNKSKCKSVTQYNLKGKKLKTFKSIADAVRYLNLNGKFDSNCTMISACCLGKISSAFNYKWKFNLV